MLARYEDIRKRIKEEPKWFDSNGVPRYDDFHPDLSPNIYAEEVCLLKIKCQECQQEFLVEMNWSRMELVINEYSRPLSERIKDKSIHYGDPPRHREEDSNCSAGDTMNCDDVEVVQFWKQEGKFLDWKRKKKLEIKLGEK